MTINTFDWKPVKWYACQFNRTGGGGVVAEKTGWGAENFILPRTQKCLDTPLHLAADRTEAVFLSLVTRLHCYICLASGCLARVFVLMWTQFNGLNQATHEASRGRMSMLWMLSTLAHRGMLIRPCVACGVHLLKCVPISLWLYQSMRIGRLHYWCMHIVGSYFISVCALRVCSTMWFTFGWPWLWKKWKVVGGIGM